MAIRVSHTTHSIGVPSELSNRLAHLGAIACLAEHLGNTSLYNDARNAYQELANSWYSRAEAEAKSKSWSTWLGGGETYNVSSPTDFEKQKGWCRIYFDRLNTSQKEAALSYAVNKYNSGNFIDNIVVNTYFYALNGREMTMWDLARR